MTMALKRSYDKMMEGDTPLSMLTQRELDYYMYHKFVNRDESSEFGSVQKFATNGWQLGICMKQRHPECRTRFTGVVPINYVDQLYNMGCGGGNKFILRDMQHIIFFPSDERFPKLSPYFEYTFLATLVHYKTPDGKKSYKVDISTLQWKPIPMPTSVVRHVFSNQVVGRTKQKKNLRELMMHKLGKYAMDLQLQGKRDTKIWQLDDLLELLSGDYEEQKTMMRLGSIKRIFFHDVMEQLYPYYDAAKLDMVELSVIRKLADLVTSTDNSVPDPILLCFKSMTCREGYLCRDGDRVDLLPELSLAHYEHICKRRSYPCTEGNLLAVKLYGALLKYEDDTKSTCVHDKKLFLLANITDDAMANMALTKLEHLYRAVKTDEHVEEVNVPRVFILAAKPKKPVVYVYRRDLYMYESMIVYATEICIRNSLTDPPRLVSDETARRYPFLPEHPICSEQRIFLEKMRVLPVSVLTGPAGSGKSAAMSHTMATLDCIRLYKESKFLAYQNNNAAEAAMKVSPFAMTCHHLLAKHYQLCTHSPRNRYRRRKKEQAKRARAAALALSSSSNSRLSDSNSMDGHAPIDEEDDEDELEEDDEFGSFKICPLENLKVIAFEEMGLAFEEVFAEIAFLAATHGKLAKIIVTGDRGQQIQMQPGNLQQSMLDGFPGWVTTFKHSHRFNSESAAVFLFNSKLIQGGRYDFVTMDGVFEVALLERPRYDLSSDADSNYLREELMNIYSKYGVQEEPGTVTIARTHKCCKLAMEAMDVNKYNNIIHNGLRVGERIMCKGNLKGVGVASREPLILMRIDDCMPKKKRTIDSLDPAEYAELELSASHFTDTVSHPKPRGMARRLVVRKESAVMTARNTWPIHFLPYDDAYQHMYVRIAAITQRSCQGSQAKFVVAIQPFFWPNADFREVFYTVATRMENRFLLITHQSVLEKWVKNTTPERYTRLGKKLRALYNKYVDQFPIPEHSDDLKECIRQEEESGIYKIDELVEEDE